MDTESSLNNSKLKRRLSYEKNDHYDSKRLNFSSSDQSNGLSTMEKYVLDGQVKESLMKIVVLEQTIRNLEEQCKTQKQEFKIEKDKLLNELSICQEQKYEIEQSQRKLKTNEAIIKSELEHLQSKMDKIAEQPKIEKELNNLKRKIDDLSLENVELREQNDRLKQQIDRINSELNFQIDQLTNENRNLKIQVDKQAQVRQEYDTCKVIQVELENKVKELEYEVSKARDSFKVEELMRESDKIHELERQNRKLTSEVEYLKALQEKTHLYKEELESCKKQIESYQERVKLAELENARLQSEIKDKDCKISSIKKSDSKNNLYESTQHPFDGKLRELNKRLNELEEENRQHEDVVDKLQKKIVRLNTERNGYKKIIDMYDSEMTVDPTHVLQKRLFELEEILNEYKKSFDDMNELKLKNSRIYRLNDTSQRSIEIQVNLTEEIYKNYEKTIHDLRAKNDLFKTAKESNSSRDEDEESDANVKYRNKMKEAFAKKKEEIEKIIRYLTGFKITFYEHTIKLSSTICKTKDNFLLFKVNSTDGSIKLMESEMAYKYAKYAEEYLFGEPKCFAGFLAAITFDLLQIKFP